MPPDIRFWSSSVGSKVLIAVSGLALVGFLILHLIGNLLFYLGPATYNHYGDKLIKNPLLIPAELGLLALFLLHAFKAVRMFIDARGARPVAYAQRGRARHTSRKSLASMTMIVSGTFLLLFVPLHLKTFKYGPHYASAEAGVRDVYRLMAEVFRHPWYVVFYVIGMVLVGFHLWHGFSSAFQSLGADGQAATPRLQAIGRVLALVIGGGFLSLPIWIFLSGTAR
jgi:succinate dehydrogenase / fumarate reductase, cytochrome b subunit